MNATLTPGRPRWAALLAAIGVSAGGCSPGQRTDVTGAEVTGTVTLDGRPVPGGAVRFYGPKDNTQADIRPDGTYRAANVPLGPVKLTVSSAEYETEYALRQKFDKGAPGVADLPEPVRVPARYGDVTATAFSLDVAPGPNTYDLTLTTK